MQYTTHVRCACAAEEGVELARRCTAALYSDDVDALSQLSQSELEQLFHNASSCQMIYEPGLTLLDVCLRAKCFNREGTVCDSAIKRSISACVYSLLCHYCICTCVDRFVRFVR